MSMWEIEALMEKTVRLIDKSEFKSNEKRNLIWNTYNLQNQFDCSFTHFRLIEILKNNEYVQQYDISDFPLTNGYKDFFFDLVNKDFEWIRQIPTEDWSENNEEIAYWDKASNKIFVDFASDFYTLNKGEFSKEYDPLHFGLIIIKEGGRQNDKSIVYEWASFLVNYLLAWFPSNKSTTELKNEYFSEIKDCILQFDYSDYKASHQGLDIINMDVNWLDEMSENQKELIKYLTQK
ncbi:hypothetical protein [Pseudozobellia sp. WGM2]|uniref:hypothetical protein n=1 Tax=Pseudozobellia sp. WGM2 TaxID=2787625 RepID=UPI001AE0C719|nr:hypothetical protein [Pseudozobellia sp. WGM2]